MYTAFFTLNNQVTTLRPQLHKSECGDFGGGNEWLFDSIIF